MKFDKFFLMTDLLNLYGPLLTTKQKKYMDLYYNNDMTLEEIAERRKIKKQSVGRVISYGERRLIEIDRRLKLLNISKKKNNIRVLVNKLKKKYTKKIKSNYRDDFKRDLKKLSELV